MTNKIARDNYKRFSFLPGNDYIASEHALETILKLIDDFNIKSVLELGMGIGSIADTILKSNPNIYYTGTEANEFCLNALRENVVDYQKINLYQSISEIEDQKKFDLIIVDGSDNSLAEIARLSHPDTILFVEGFRGEQVKLIKEIFSDVLHVEIISGNKNPDYGPFPSDRWGGGGQLLFINPTLAKKIYWLREKARSFIVRRARKFKKS